MGLRLSAAGAAGADAGSCMLPPCLSTAAQLYLHNVIAVIASALILRDNATYTLPPSSVFTVLA